MFIPYDKRADPMIEVFYVDAATFFRAAFTADGTWMQERMDTIEGPDPEWAGPGGWRRGWTAARFLQGWYWWPCEPGCLPDGEADGPYATEAEAREAAMAAPIVSFEFGDGL